MEKLASKRKNKALQNWIRPKLKTVVMAMISLMRCMDTLYNVFISKAKNVHLEYSSEDKENISCLSPNLRKDKIKSKYFMFFF